MTPFWIGFIWFVVGMFVGANVGIFVVSLCVAANTGDKMFLERGE